MIKRHSHKLFREVTATMNMGLNYPLIPVEIFPSDSFKLELQNLTRFLPQISPVNHSVNITMETYTLPYRQLFDKIGLSWDDFLTGGEDGLTEVQIPTVTTPAEGYDPGSLADFLGIPTNYMDLSRTPAVKVIQPSIEVSALPVIAYMHIINEYYRDQNFVKKLDLTRYQEFLDGTYQFEDIHGNPLGYNLFRPGAPGLFPRAWSRDYFGRAMPNTQRGTPASVPMGDIANLTPPFALIKQSAGGFISPSVNSTLHVKGVVLIGFASYNIDAYVDIVGGGAYPIRTGGQQEPASNMSAMLHITSLHGYASGESHPIDGFHAGVQFDSSGVPTLYFGSVGQNMLRYLPATGFNYTWSPVAPVWNTVAGTQVADLSGVVADLQSATQVSILTFRLAARMQRFGEVLQQAGARAVEYTLAFFGVRVPDDRIQRPIYHGAFRLPVIFSEVMQTSESTSNSPQANLAGHGVTGGTNRPIHIKVIEHGFLIHIVSCMPRSQYHNILPRLYLRRNRFDIPNPVFTHVGEQAIQQIELFPRTSDPTKRFGYVPRYSELAHLPSTVHGHMKDTFAHWHMARIYPDSEPQLSAAFRYELPTNRSFAVKNEDQMQVLLGIYMRARRPFPVSSRPGIHIV